MQQSLQRNREEDSDMEERKVALVTGAGRGIGKAIALKLAAEGMFVVVNYNGSAEAAADTVKEIEEMGQNAAAIQCDVSDFAACEAFIKRVIVEYGRLDVLVNNAGITRDNLIMKMKEEDFDEVIRVNLKSAFNTIKCSARQMLKQRSGRIINISSVVGVMGNAGQANYAAAKAGMIGLTKTMARELASRHVTVNAIAPGFIETSMTEKLPEQIRTSYQGQIPMGAFGKPEDVADAAAFLASEKAGYITGQVLCVDGGMCM